MPLDIFDGSVTGLLESDKDYARVIAKRKKQDSDYLVWLRNSNEEWRKREHRSREEAEKRYKKLERQYKERREKDSEEIARRFREKRYKEETLDGKKRMLEEMARDEKVTKQKLENEREYLESNKKTFKSRLEWESRMQHIIERTRQSEERSLKVKKQAEIIEKASLSVMSKRERLAYKARKAESDYQTKQKDLGRLRANLATAREELGGLKEGTSEYAAKQAEISKLESQETAAASAVGASKRELFRAQMIQNMVQSLTNAVSNTLNKSMTAVDSAIKDYTSYQSRAMARLQGLGIDYSTIGGNISSKLATSPYVSQKKMLENLNTLIDKGIGYNLEQRAFLATISDKIVTTFDAFDSNLSRLIRLQQADTTMARMGMEASLTKFFNNIFSDTSYLSDMYDTVSKAILDANATMTKEQSTEFEYTVQKWLGSLYALGLSESAVSNIAQGINYLGTGNVSALSGNQQLQTLLAMSAQRGGVDYASMLTGGLTSSATNQLFAGMVKYLSEIADNTSANKVVASAYGDVLGLTMSDWRALQNIQASDISKIGKTSLSYAGAKSELASQFGQLSSRVPLSEMISNVFGNLAYTMGQSIAENPATYTSWLVTGLIESATGGTKLPMVMGTGIDTTVEALARLAIMGASAWSFVPKIFSSLTSGGISPELFSGIETLSRGEGFAGIREGTGISSTVYIGGGASSDIRQQAMSDVQQSVQEVKGSEEKTQQHDFDELYDKMFGAEQKSVKIMLDSLSDEFREKMTDLLSSVEYKVNVTNSGADQFFSRSLLGLGGWTV